MELKNRVVIISNKNMIGIQKLYGKCSMNDLERIVNNHVAVALEEINEDINYGKKSTAL